MQRRKRLMALVLVLMLIVISTGVLTACKKNNNKYASTLHTYYGAMTESPATWNPYTMQSTFDSMPLDYTTSSLYEFEYNDDMTGYVINPVMAASDPVDVTSEYIGTKWGYEEGDKNYVFRVELNPDAVWENGDPINADTYIESLKRLLDPDLANYRASNYYSGSFVIHNAKNYVYKGKTVLLSDNALMSPDFDWDQDLYLGLNAPAYILEAIGFKSQLGIGTFGDMYDYFADTYAEQAAEAFETKEDIVISEDLVFEVGGYATEEELLEAYLQFKFKGEGKSDLRENIYDLYTYLTDEESVYKDGFKKGYVDATEEALEYIGNILGLWASAPADYAYYAVSYPSTFADIDFSEVGLQKKGEYTIDFILDTDLQGFYIKYSLSMYLVHPATWDANIIEKDGVKSSAYGTAIDKYLSYGPYKITKFIDGQVMEFDRNEKWFGYQEKYADRYGTFIRGIDGKECKQYETDRIVITQAKDIGTREQMFLAGQLDGLGLNAEMLETYRSSEAIYFTQGESTFYGIICSDEELLKDREDKLNAGNPGKYNKTILANKKFRKALCYAINRTELCAALYPAGTAAFGLFSNAVMADPENSVAYRSLEVAKQALVEFWGIEYGEDKTYKTLDAAYNAITGYDIETARRLVDEAVDEWIAAGKMTSSAIVKIQYCAGSESDTETKWYNTFKSNFDELFKGTKLEGKFEYEANFTLGNDFGDKIHNGECDTAWGFGWSGGTLDPYGLFEVYVDAAYNKDDGYQYDAWNDWDEVALTLTLKADENGKATTEEHEYTHSVAEWAVMLFGPGEGTIERGLKAWTFGNADDAIRAQVLAALEKQILLEYCSIPLMNEGSVALKSYKINYGQETYIYGLGRGGTRYMTYNYTDGEWAKYVDENKGKLAY